MVKEKGDQELSILLRVTTQVMTPAIGRMVLDDGSHDSIPADWVAHPSQNICIYNNNLVEDSVNKIKHNKRIICGRNILALLKFKNLLNIYFLSGTTKS